MGLTLKEAKEIRKLLDSSKNPLFFFDDDPDGLCSFLLLYRYAKKGHGVVVKSLPELREQFVRKVEDYNPDVIFVLDKPKVSQEFIDQANRKIVWIDHHEPQERKGVMYFNPRLRKEANVPTSYLCHQIVESDLWIAAVGVVADWVYKKDIYDAFSRQYPELLPPGITDPQAGLFETPLGEIVRLFSFILKGDTRVAMGCVKILTRVGDIRELVEQKTPQAKYLTKRFKEVNREYQSLLKSGCAAAKKQDPLLLFSYTDDTISLTSDLSNELLHRFPEKTIIVCREKSGEMKCSLRSAALHLPPLVQQSLAGLEGYGGGHEHACGAVVKTHNFDEFIRRIRGQI